MAGIPRKKLDSDAEGGNKEKRSAFCQGKSRGKISCELGKKEKTGEKMTIEYK